MKKKLMLCSLVLVGLFTLVGCGGKDRTYKELFDQYVKAYTTADVELAKDLFPPFYVEYAKSILTQEHLDNSLKNAKDLYGDDFTIVYEISKDTKLTDDELKTVNEKYKSTFNTDEEASECYKFEGTMTFKGEKRSDADSIANWGYCKYNKWYLVNY